MDMLDSYLRKSGVTSAVVDFGGSILTIGKDNGNSRRISITADETNTLVGTLTVDEGYIATSNGANRYVEHNGKKYIHIIDPSTAYPADNGIKKLYCLFCKRSYKRCAVYRIFRDGRRKNR